MGITVFVCFFRHILSFSDIFRITFAKALIPCVLPASGSISFRISRRGNRGFQEGNGVCKIEKDRDALNSQIS